jgi:transketolase
MRNEFSQAIEKIALRDEKLLFLTGDLGYKALENLQEKMGDRFINTGVAEQNMVGMAAGLAHRGFKVICYSIAPFVVYRCWEQFRNDACFHNLPVFLVGNGGGYGYGIMGSSHHALEDLAGLSSLPNVKCWVPAFADEVESICEQMVQEQRPAYLRLGYGLKSPTPIATEASFQILQQSPQATCSVVAIGPVANNVVKALASDSLSEQVNLLTVQHLPLQLGEKTAALLAQSTDILVVEEHVSVGGLGQQLALQLLEKGIHPQKFVSLRAQGYPDGTYGSQAFHQQQSGLDADHIQQQITEMIKK